MNKVGRKTVLVPERGSQREEVNPGVLKEEIRVSCRKDTSFEVRPLLVLALLIKRTLLPSETRMIECKYKELELTKDIVL